MRASTDVAVVGAGPYGLSVAAHLEAEGIDCRVFGEPMQLWRDHMPPGMHLKSDGKSSNLSDPSGALPLENFCRARGLPFHRALLPVSIETLIAYGMAFQERFVPHLERRRLAWLERVGDRLGLHFDDGTRVTANRVVLAVGMMPFRHVPDIFTGLPRELASHSSAFGSLEGLRGRDVAILGAGSSALDLAALLQAQGTAVTLVSRAPGVAFHSPPAAHRDLLHRLARPDSQMGASWLLRICDDAPQLIHALPAPLRHAIVARTLGPAAGYFVRDKVLGKVALRCGQRLTAVTEQGGRVRLQTRGGDGALHEGTHDHVILATGYRLDMRRLGFLSPDILAGLETEAGAPALSRNFESSVPGLYFAGYASVPSFGPVMRFIAGVSHPARRLARHLVRRPRAELEAVPSQAMG